MGKNLKLTEKRAKILTGAIREGYTITDACDMACIGRSTYYKWLSDYPDFNKAMVEATDLQWKYASWRVRHGYRSYKRPHLNRPSSNYQSPNNLPFTMPNTDESVSGSELDELSDDDAHWLMQSIQNAY